MHIEPGILDAVKITGANVAAVAVLAAYAPQLVQKPTLILRTVLAALFFSLFMESFHMPVGASELHFVGAMPIYMLLGFVPTLVGFAAGLLMQGLLFEPQDLVHLGVNSLSLMVPLMVLHHSIGKRLAGQFNVKNILKLDASYYAGVTVMVGFWLSMGTEATPFADWALFASSYLGLVVVEPFITYGLVRLAQTAKNTAWAHKCFDERVLAAA